VKRGRATESCTKQNAGNGAKP